MSDDNAIKFPDKGNLNTYIWLPVTMKAFEDLANELLKMTNDQMVAQEVLAGRDPTGLGFGGDYYAQHLVGAIHSAEVKGGKVLKSYLYESCWGRIAKHVSYHLLEELQKKAAPKGETSEPLPDEVTNEVSAPTGQVT